jgi:hypothetical protein
MIFKETKRALFWKILKIMLYNNDHILLHERK